MAEKGKTEAFDALEEPPDESLSRLHENSSYAPFDGEVDENPPPGPTVIQTLGKPAEAAPKAGKSGA